MTKNITIIEGNHEGLVERKGDALKGAAEGFATCLAAFDPDLTFHFVRPHFRDHIFHDALLANSDAIVFTGSANAWSADEPEAEPARQMMQLALSSGKPVFGSCYGMQLAVAVLGGQNRSNPVATEFAIARDITLTPEGRAHPLYKGKDAIFDARCMHRDEVAILPQDAISLSGNAHSAHQAMAYEAQGMRFWGVQYHPELRFTDIAHYIEKNDVTSFSQASRFAKELGIDDNPDAIIADFKSFDTATGQERAALIAKYKLRDGLSDDVKHQCELGNFINSL